MKKLTKLIVLVTFMVFASASHAALIGLQESDLQKPDVLINSNTQFVYDHTGTGVNKLTITALDKQITLPDQTVVYLTYPGVETNFSMTLFLDDSGKILSQSANLMTEILSQGTVEVAGHTYSATTTLLTGDVYAFGWGKVGSSEARFDFLFTNVNGAWVTDGIWPNIPVHGIIFSTVSVLNIDAWADGENPWLSDWTITSGKADKAPVPEPATLVLFGIGLVGISIGFRKIEH